MTTQPVKRAKEKEVISVPEPKFTKSWHPISHKRVIKALEKGCKSEGIGIVKRDYSLGRDGLKMFGVWDLDIKNKKMGYSLGFRNSLDKSFAVGICAGTSVFVCSNMMFSGEFIEFKRHTSGLDDERLFEVTESAIGGAIIQIKELKKWHKGLRKVWMDEDEKKCMVYDMVTQNVFSGGKIQQYLTHLEEEKALLKDKDSMTSLYNMHGAATRLMRNWNLLKVSDSTKRLKMVCDDYHEMKKAA